MEKQNQNHTPVALVTDNLGMIFMIVAMLLLPVGDTLAKVLTSVMTPVEVTMWRFLSQAICFLPVAFVMRRYLRGSMFSPIVALSGLLMVICVLGAGDCICSDANCNCDRYFLRGTAHPDFAGGVDLA